MCLQQALAERNGSHAAEGDHDDSEEDAKGMARLFAEVGEAYTGLIAEAAPQVQAPVEALLDVASHPDDAICSISFNFWHRLSRALTIGLHPEPLGAHACAEGRGGLCVGTGGLGWGACCAMAGCWSAEPPPTHPPSHTTLPPAESEEGPVSDEERERRVRVFTPTLERLVALIRGRVRFHDNFESWHRDERQDFKRARCVAPGAGVCGMRVREGGCGGHQRPVAISGPPSHCPRIAASNRALALLHLTALPPSPSTHACSVAVGDTLIDCASVLGGGRMLQLLVEPLLELSKQVGAACWASANGSSWANAAGQPPATARPPSAAPRSPPSCPPQVTSGGTFDWRTAEAALYCVRAVHRCAPLPGDALMTSLFASLPMLPAVPQLQYTVALTVGAYADWLSDTAQRSEEGRTLLSQVGAGAGVAQGAWPHVGCSRCCRPLPCPHASCMAPTHFTSPHPASTPTPPQLLTMLMRYLSEPEASSASALSIRRLCDGCAALLAAGSMEPLMGCTDRSRAAVTWRTTPSTSTSTRTTCSRCGGCGWVREVAG